MSMDLTANPFYGALVRAVDETAPPCPECDGSMTAENVRRHEDWSEHGTGDAVTLAVELYRCDFCNRRIVRQFELDRVTRAERDEELERAPKRAQLRRDLYERYGILTMSKRVRRGIEAQVRRQYPYRDEPDLMARYSEAREVAP